MNKKTSVQWIIFLIALAVIFIGTSQPSEAGHGKGPVIYVTSQDLYFDSIILTDLPIRGPFQLLEMEGPMNGPQTEFGPGDRIIFVAGGGLMKTIMVKWMTRIFISCAH